MHSDGMPESLPAPEHVRGRARDPAARAAARGRTGPGRGVPSHQDPSHGGREPDLRRRR